MLIKQQIEANDLLNALNERVDETGKHLRGFADLWISSGTRSNGVEEPKSRILPEFARENIACLSTDNPISIHVMPDGALEGLFHFTPGLKSAVLDQQAQKGYDARYGIYMFLLFLDSGDLRFRLAKCQREGCAAPYFFRDRLHPIYKNGAVCPHHRKQAASLRARKDERDDLLELAAQFWPDWTESQHPNRSLWVAGEVNARRVGTERRISQKWVSRNAVKIKAEVERRNHAKG